MEPATQNASRLPECADRYPHRLQGKTIKKKSAPNATYASWHSTWLGWLDLNQRNDGVKVRCLTPWRQPNIEYGAMKPIAPYHLCGVDSRIRTDGLQCHKLAL